MQPQAAALAGVSVPQTVREGDERLTNCVQQCLAKARAT
jgi:hypothetical protein